MALEPATKAIKTGEQDPFIHSLYPYFLPFHDGH